MKIRKTEGLIAAPFTPMKADGSVDTGLIKAYHHFLIANNVKGAFICGSTGEGVSLTYKERVDIAEAWALCNKHTPEFSIITMVGGNSIKECISLAQHSRDIGITAVACTSPFYYTVNSVQTLAEMCLEIGMSVPEIPFYYYHIPGLTGVHFPMLQLIQELDGRMENFAGIKYTDDNLMDYLSCLNYKNGKYDLLWGRDESLLSGLPLGVKGAVGSTYNYAAPLYYRIISSFNEGNLAEAVRLQQLSVDMISLLSKYGGMATGKSFMKILGFDCGEFRLPITNMGADDFIRFQEDVDKLGFKEFCSVYVIEAVPNSTP